MNIPFEGQIICPHAGCEATLHIQKFSELPRDSGEQMEIDLLCEEGHESKIRIMDHSGSLHWYHGEVFH
jgi:hypothetical protein